LIEFVLYTLCMLAAALSVTWHLLTRKRRREENWPHPPLFISQAKDRSAVKKAFEQNAIVLGYDVHGKPWLWPDATRIMQAVVCGATGSGKTTLLRNIITQDLFRTWGPLEQPRRMPMLIFDGKADSEYLAELLPAIEAAGRMHQLRILNPSRPDISVRYNPFVADEALYQEHANFVFESFDLKEDFFHGHQATYLNDLARVLTYTGKRFNIYDVMVLALDQQVLRDQIAIARSRLQSLQGVSHQRRLNFEMSVKMLQKSFEDRERVTKIQGLLNELMTFLDDELSIITGAYDEMLSLDEVIDQELILFVSLNTNKNSKAVTALGRMLLQNMQLMIGKRYENAAQEPRDVRPMVSVILDEFAPFAYSNFAQILQTARGTNTAFLFSLQAIPQLLNVGRGFRDEVSSAPNTNMILRTKDEETAQYFLKASARVRQKRRTLAIQRRGLFQDRYETTGSGSETDIKDTRAQDEHIKNLPVGQMEILMSDNRQGTLHSHLHVRVPHNHRFPGLVPRIYPTLHSVHAQQEGANLRFKDPEVVRRSGSPWLKSRRSSWS
jgi:Type IV secretory system Conjugative DNA transfer